MEHWLERIGPTEVEASTEPEHPNFYGAEMSVDLILIAVKAVPKGAYDLVLKLVRKLFESRQKRNADRIKVEVDRIQNAPEYMSCGGCSGLGSFAYDYCEKGKNVSTSNQSWLAGFKNPNELILVFRCQRCAREWEHRQYLPR